MINNHSRWSSTMWAFSFAFLVLSFEQGGWLFYLCNEDLDVLVTISLVKSRRKGSKAIYIVCFKSLFKIVVHCIFSHFCSMK